jgi:hypothetical protein
MQSAVLGTVDDPSLRAYVAWVPILPEDSLDAAREARSLVQDGRVSHFWDAERTLPALLAPLLGLPEGWPAWDVYLAYGRGARWTDAPPAPSFWHHQLGDQVRAPVLDGGAFGDGVRALLAGKG